jgi:hypothetical protein
MSTGSSVTCLFSFVEGFLFGFFPSPLGTFFQKVVEGFGDL